jgi:tetratricopeptide (TPR) repeat protein
LRKKNNKPTDTDYLRNVEDLGNLYNQKGDYDKAIEYYQKAIDIKRNTYGNSHPQYAMTVNYLGLVYYNQKDYETAIEKFREAKQIMELGKHENLYYASFISNIGDAYKNLGNRDSSKFYYDKSMVFKRKYAGEGSIDYLTQINDIANIHYQKGEYEQALKLYQEAAQKELLARDITADYRVYIRNCGLAYKELKQLDNEIGAIETGADAQKKLFGENSNEYAYDLNEVAYLYYNHPTKSAKAGELYAKCVAIHASFGDTKSETYLVYLKNLGLFQYDKAQNYVAARKAFEEFVESKKSVGNIQNIDYAFGMNYLGMTYYKEKDAKCVSYLEEAAKIYKYYEGENQNYGGVIQNLADFYFLHQKDYNKAEIYQIALCNISKTAYKEADNNITIKEYSKDLRALSYSQIMNGKMAEAEKTANEGMKITMNDSRFEIRLAFIYCFTNRFEKGKAILLKHKNQQYPSETNKVRLFKEVYKEMYADLKMTKLNKQVIEKLQSVVE